MTPENSASAFRHTRDIMAIPGDPPFHSTSVAPATPTPTSRRILIVDDDPALRASLPLVLAADDREFSLCGSVQAAIEHLERARHDLILLDYRLPDATGLALLDWLADHGREEAVIMLSGEDAIEAAIDTLRRGADDFVRKPFHPAQLQRAVDGSLHKTALEHTNREMEQRLKASESLHRYLVERSPDLIFTLDREDRFTYLNPRIEALLGYQRDSLLGQSFLSVVVGEDTDRVRTLLHQQRTRPNESFDTEVRLRKLLPHTPSASHAFVTVLLHGIPMGGNGRKQAAYGGLYGVARDISERKRAEEIISFQAYHDQLTRLPNRTLFRDRLELAIAQAQRRGSALAVLFIDMDRFKLVNDTYGHAEGDAVLRGMAQRLQHALRRGDTLARLGGDEFTVLLPDIAGPEDAEIIARKVLGMLVEPFPLSQGNFRATASVGIALFPRDGQNAEALTQHADIAMYQVKRSGKNGYRFFAPELNRHHQSRIAFEHDLRHALERKQLELHYQPQISLSQQRVVGVEALLRWNHPENGLLGPDTFVPIAEDIGLIGELSHWVMDEACAQLAQWRTRGHDDLRMSINLASHDFDHGDVVGMTTASLGRHNLPADRIELEITESMMMQDTVGVSAQVRALRELGISIAIDDFGTGYSALAYLQQLPVNVLKIDRNFVRDLDPRRSNPILSAITGIARGFGLKLIAEGVERPAQALLLGSLGCDLMQGYYFGRPASAAVIEPLLNKKPRSIHPIPLDGHPQQPQP